MHQKLYCAECESLAGLAELVELAELRKSWGKSIFSGSDMPRDFYPLEVGKENPLKPFKY